MKKFTAIFLFIMFISIAASAQLTVTIITQSNVTCYSQCDGSLTASVTGGVAPYSYVWMPGGMTTATITGLCAGNYTCTVTDAASASTVSSAVVTQPPQLTLAPTVTLPTTCTSCDGSIAGGVTGGTPPYNYLWSPSNMMTQTITNVCAGSTHTCLVTDANGCVLSGSSTIPAPYSVTVGVTPGPQSICQGTTVNYNATSTGGSAPYNYSWSCPGGTPSSSNVQSPLIQYNTAGSYTTTVTVIEAGGCTGTGTVSLTVGAGPTVTITQIPATCNQSNGSLTGSGALSYTWQPGNLSSATIINQAAGTYTCIGTDASACTSSVTVVLGDSCDYVWPGDANDDAVADNVDILDIGIANGATGTTRANASLTWIGQPSAPWGQTLASGTDYKWVDCDGDGTVSLIDTQAVTLNYGQTHSNRYGAPQYSSTAPDLSISFDQDSLAAGSPGTLTLSLGDVNNQANGVYGIAFRLNYDAAQLNTSSFGMAGGTTWFGNPASNMMRVVLHPSPANGFVDVAITRYDHQDVSGYGTLGQIYFTATTALMSTGNAVMVPMTVSNLLVVNSAGTSIPANVTSDSLVVADPIMLSVPSAAENQAAVYPNPANENIQVEIPEGEDQLVTIEDMSGRVVYAADQPAGTNTISVQELPAGVYFIRVTANDKTSSVQRIAITH